MKTVVIHVGTHKTGTTALQLFFSRNSDRLREHDIHYVSSGRGGWQMEAHHALAVALRAGKSRVPAKVVKEVESSTCSKILLSSEMFMEFDAPRTLQRLFSDCRVQIVMYVRRQDLRALSEYNYAVKIFVARFPGVVQDYYLCKRYLRWLDYHLQLEHKSEAGHSHQAHNKGDAGFRLSLVFCRTPNFTATGWNLCVFIQANWD